MNKTIKKIRDWLTLANVPETDQRWWAREPDRSQCRWISMRQWSGLPSYTRIEYTACCVEHLVEFMRQNEDYGNEDLAKVREDDQGRGKFSFGS